MRVPAKACWACTTVCCVLKIIVLQLDLKIYLQIDNFLLKKINDEEKKPKQ